VWEVGNGKKLFEMNSNVHIALTILNMEVKSHVFISFYNFKFVKVIVLSKCVYLNGMVLLCKKYIYV
jgi:hypothetical protein